MISSHFLLHPAHWVEWRKRQGISLAAIEAATKISPRYLAAIESGDLQRLPGGVYGLSYVRQYARAIHYDEGELVGLYRRAVAPEAPAEAVPRESGGWLSRLRDRICSTRLVSGYGEIPHPQD